jgi:hypothetical protein
MGNKRVVEAQESCLSIAHSQPPHPPILPCPTVLLAVTLASPREEERERKKTKARRLQCNSRFRTFPLEPASVITLLDASIDAFHWALGIGLV